jgi:hypothetical protein
MKGNDARGWRAGLLIGATLILGACGHDGPNSDNSGDQGINAYPANYKSDILAAMHAYLSDPTGIRDAAIAAPVLKSFGFGKPTRYMVCLQFNAKKNANDYAGVKEVAAVFLAGRFDQIVEAAHEQCAGTAYTPFPELQKLLP